MSQHQSEGGVLYVWWRGKRYSEAKWDQQRAEWAAAYPHIVTSTGGTRTIFESSADRSRIMTRRFLGTLFEKLGTDNAYIPFRFQEDFRVDMGGDVVSPRAQNFSVCMYDGDHVFPWSRGGLTHTSNMAALQFYANRWVKGDRLLPELTRDSMLCGISAPQFAALLAEVGRRTPRVYVHGAEEEGGGRGGYEARLAQAEQLAVMWLLIPIPLSGLNIQALLRGCSGGDIYDFFEGMSRLPAKRAAP
ncbi:hypothetical protein B484DRAFT_332040 [Ochromonadaceae sp. CCMP2298]|nr:hypothetical protein B484DRAFT_332040 [Ochromonadaceae sp. CCMP2298]